MSLLRRGKKPHRPLDWDSWEDERKITWLTNRKKPTTSETKELRFLTQKKKFAGFAEWLKKRREAEKNTDTYKRKQIIKCRQKRKVSSCEKCCRYHECLNGKKAFDELTSNGELRLCHAIILAIEEDIKRCWRHGWKDQLTYWIKVLSSQRTNVLTAETVDGYASAQAIVVWCKKHYGEFEPIYEKCQATYKPIIEKLEKEIAVAKEKKNPAKVEKLNDEVVKAIQKLYGDTM